MLCKFFEWNEHGTWTVTFINNENRQKETYFIISDALTLFSHKVIFPVDNNNKKNLESFAVKWKYRLRLGTCNVMQIFQVKRTWNLIGDVCSEMPSDWKNYLGFLAEEFSRLIRAFWLLGINFCVLETVTGSVVTQKSRTWRFWYAI